MSSVALEPLEHKQTCDKGDTRKRINVFWHSSVELMMQCDRLSVDATENGDSDY